MEVYKVFREAACSNIYWNIVFIGKLYLEDFGFYEQMFILK